MDFATIPLLSTLLIPLLAWADRQVGGAGKRSHAYAAVALAGLPIAYFAGGLATTLAVLVWAGWRSIGFFGGSATVTDRKALISALARNFMVVPFALVVPAGYPFLLPAAVFAAFSLALACAYGAEKNKAVSEGRPINPKFNVALESARGAAAGAAILAGTLLSA